MMKNLSSMGRSLPRLESVEKAVGAAKYTVDMALPGMLHGKIFRSPYAHARILKVDVSKAAGLPGVRAILTGQELAKISKPYGPVVRDEMGLQSEKVRYVGDEVAAVAAVSEEIAEEALHLIDVEYEELPALLDPEVALQLGAPQIHEGVERNKVWSAHIGVGDVEQGFKEADRVFKRRFVTSKVTATPPEPHAALASYNRYTGELTIWTSSQCIFYTRLELATSLGLSEHKVRAVAPAIGGGFGHKVDGMYSTDLCAAVLSMRTGCPVKIVLTREEETMATRTRHSTIRDVEVGVKNDGTIIAYCEKTIVDNGAYTSFGPGVAQLTEATAPGPYKIPNLHLHADLVYTNKAPGGAFRGFGNPQATFARESILDEIAERLGVDRIQFRLKNAVDPSDLPYVTPLGYELQTCGVKDCIERSAAAIGWEEKSQD
ncbi:MAG: molybdopterin-dependent oxidoreductase, partial [Chloroflexi bacterium]|nr:molybdopterin-dependent oxidoreductase [Chloroflexota bacterium]